MVDKLTFLGKSRETWETCHSRNFSTWWAFSRRFKGPNTRRETLFDTLWNRLIFSTCTNMRRIRK